MGDLVSMFLYQPPRPATPIHPSRFFWLPSNDGASRIPVTYIKYSANALTLLYSHGNAEDLGLVYEYLSNLSRGLKVNVCAYDYTGYGRSRPDGAAPSERSCYADIDAVYNFLIRDHRTRPRNVVLYGRSLGGGPSCWLADREWRRGAGVGGLVLHSAFTSVFRVALNTGSFTVKGDQFPNIDRLGSLGCPVYVVHGTKDEIVPFSHGKALYDALPEACRTVEPFWAEGMGHNNIDADMPLLFFKNLKLFLRAVDERNLRRTSLPSSTKSSSSSTSRFWRATKMRIAARDVDVRTTAHKTIGGCVADLATVCLCGPTTTTTEERLVASCPTPFRSWPTTATTTMPAPEERSDVSAGRARW